MMHGQQNVTYGSCSVDQ